MDAQLERGGSGVALALLMDKNAPTTEMLFPNIIMSDRPLKPLTRWGLARMEYLKTHQPFVAAQFGVVGLHKHCLEIEEQAEERKRNMMAAIRKDPNNRERQDRDRSNAESKAKRLENSNSGKNDLSK